MKKNFLLFEILLCCSLSNYSQNTNTGTYYYCELVRIPGFLPLEIEVAVVLGLKEGFYSAADKKRVENKIDSMVTMADAMNFMDSEGWEFLAAYNIHTTYQEHATRWILRRKRNK